MRKVASIVLSLVMFCAVNHAQAVDITINLNGFNPGSGMNVTGPSSYSAGPFYGAAATYTAAAVAGAGVYSVDFYHNSGLLGSDFNFSFDGTNVTSVTTNNGGTGTYNMVSSFGGTTITLNTSNIIYNANSGQTGSYYGGAFPYAQPAGGAPNSYFAIPGTQPIDNLGNTGAGNEDFAYQVDGAFNLSAAPGNGGGPVAYAIPNSEYVTFSGNQVNVRSETVHYVLDANAALAMNLDLGVTGDTGWTGSGSTWHREFNMVMPIGGAGTNVWAFDGFDSVTSNLVNPDGTPLNGTSSASADFLFRPTLRFDGTSNGSGFYWMGPGPGIQNTVFAHVSQFSGPGYDLNIAASLPAFIPPVPEPASCTLLGLGMLGLMARRRKGVRLA